MQDFSFSGGFHYFPPLIEGACVVITVAWITFRLPLLREGLLQGRYSVPNKLILMLLFSAFAVYGTHQGMVISPGGGLDGAAGPALGEYDAILNFRDMAVLISGLLSGPWVGAGVGMLAGWERYQLGGFTALACGLATVLVGLLSGWVYIWKRGLITPACAAAIAILAVLLQQLLILWLSAPFAAAIQLVNTILLPMLFINAGGCYLFISIVRTLGSEQRERLVYYKAQLEPHFIMNTLNAIRALVRTDPDSARLYITRLGKFMQETQRYVRETTVTVREELEQVMRYADFQQLRFPDKLTVRYDIGEHFPDDIRLPPRTLLTLVENALTHGRRPDQPITVNLKLALTGRRVQLEVEDNGKGIASSRLKFLGKKPVQSTHPGGGHALCNLFQMLRLTYGTGAELNIHSQENQGATVRISLPCHHPPALHTSGHVTTQAFDRG